MRFECFDDLINYYNNCFLAVSNLHDITSYWTFWCLNKTVRRRFKADLKKLKKFEKLKDKKLMLEFKKNRKQGIVSYFFSEKRLEELEKISIKEFKVNMGKINNNSIQKSKTKRVRKEEKDRVKKVVKKIREPDRGDFARNTE